MVKVYDESFSKLYLTSDGAMFQFVSFCEKKSSSTLVLSMQVRETRGHRRSFMPPTIRRH